MAATAPGGDGKTAGGGRQTPWLRWALPVAVLALLLTLRLGSRPRAQGTVLDYSRFFALVQQGHVDRIDIDGQSVTGDLKPGTNVDGKTVGAFSTTTPAQADAELMPALRAQNVDVAVRAEHVSLWGPILITVVPWVLILGGWMWLARRARGAVGMGPLQGVLKGRARR